MTLWNKFENNFSEIINNINEYKETLNFTVNFEYNILFYSTIGFPFDLFINEIIKIKYNLKNINKTEQIWNKNIIYNENQYFIEIDLNNPNMPNKIINLTEMLLFIIKSKTIINKKHLIIIKNFNKLKEDNYFSFRIVLEKFYNNCYFICTTNRITDIELPIKSRFHLFRLRLFKINEIIDIFNKYLNKQLNKNLIEISCRNIIFCIFIAQVEINEPLLVNDDFCKLSYPPLKTFLESKYNLNDIRQLSYKYCQYNLTVKDIAMDFLRLDIKNYKKILDNAILIEDLISKSNKGREPLYIEAFLCQILI